jgi:hypothetical protein
VDYHLTLVHKPGAQNRADTLSRHPDYDTGEKDNKDVIVLPEHLFTNATEILSLEQQVYEAQEEHEEQMKGLRKEFSMDVMEGKTFYQGRLIIPDEEELKRQILQQYHDHPLAGHPGIANTILAVAKEFWWPEIRKFATAYVRGCAICQSMKPGTTKPKPPLLPITTNERQNPFQMISVDLITNLPISNGYDSILTIVDHGCSKAAIFLPCQKTINAPGIAALYVQRVFPFFGIPQ